METQLEATAGVICCSSTHSVRNVNRVEEDSATNQSVPIQPIKRLLLIFANFCRYVPSTSRGTVVGRESVRKALSGRNNVTFVNLADSIIM